MSALMPDLSFTLVFVGPFAITSSTWERELNASITGSDCEDPATKSISPIISFRLRKLPAISILFIFLPAFFLSSAISFSASSKAVDT